MHVIQKQMCEITDDTTTPVTGYYFPALSIPSIVDGAGRSLVRNAWNDFHFVSADYAWDVPVPISKSHAGGDAALLSVTAEAGALIVERDGRRLGGRELDIAKEGLEFEYGGRRWTEARCDVKRWDVEGFACREYLGKGYPEFDERVCTHVVVGEMRLTKWRSSAR
jgi:hypothetical protein